MAEMSKLNLEEKQRAAVAFKKMVGRRFNRFECDIAVIEKGCYNEEDLKNVKDLNKDTEEITDRYEDIITYLDSVYSAKPAKKKKDMKEVADNFTEVTERRNTLRKKVKEANKAIEAARNKEEVNKGKNGKEASSKDGRRGGSKHEAKKQFKQPTGVLPDRISSKHIPLMDQDWASDMKFYIRTCSKLDILSIAGQRPLCKRFVEPSLWSQVVFFNSDNMTTIVKRVEERFKTLQPLFATTTGGSPTQQFRATC